MQSRILCCLILCATLACFNKVGETSDRYSKKSFLQKIQNIAQTEVVKEYGKPVSVGTPIRYYEGISGKELWRSKNISFFLDSVSKNQIKYWMVPVFEDSIYIGVIRVSLKGDTTLSVDIFNEAGMFDVTVHEISTVWPLEKGYHPQIIGCDYAYRLFQIPELKFQNLTPFSNGLPYEEQYPFIKKCLICDSLTMKEMEIKENYLKKMKSLKIQDVLLKSEFSKVDSLHLTAVRFGQIPFYK